MPTCSASFGICDFFPDWFNAHLLQINAELHGRCTACFYCRATQSEIVIKVMDMIMRFSVTTACCNRSANCYNRFSGMHMKHNSICVVCVSNFLRINLSRNAFRYIFSEQLSFNNNKKKPTLTWVCLK